MSTDPHIDDESIRQAYRATAQGEPGPQLDACILQAAHAALETPARKPARWSWLILPFSAAAVAILVTTLVLQFRPTPSTPALETASAPPAQSMKPEIAAAPAIQPPDLKIASAKPAKKAEGAFKQDQALQIATAEQAEKSQRRTDTAKQAVAEEQTKQKKQAFNIATAEPAPAPMPAPMADAAPAAVGAAASKDIPPRAVAAPPPAPVARASPSVDRLAEAEKHDANEPKQEAFGSLAKAQGPAQPTEKQIEDIRKLQREGKLEAAKKALVELRKQFPQYKVPEDLRALIEPATKDDKTPP